MLKIMYKNLVQGLCQGDETKGWHVCNMLYKQQRKMQFSGPCVGPICNKKKKSSWKEGINVPPHTAENAEETFFMVMKVRSFIILALVYEWDAVLIQLLSQRINWAGRAKA